MTLALCILGYLLVGWLTLAALTAFSKDDWIRKEELEIPIIIFWPVFWIALAAIPWGHSAVKAGVLIRNRFMRSQKGQGL